MSARPEAARLAEAGLALLGTPYAEMDCQAFAERCLRAAGIRLDLAGSNAWYRRMTWTGTPEECRKRFVGVPAGAFLFILEADGAPKKYTDGLGNASHMGIRTADGAVHASQSRGCVCSSAFAERSIPGGWNRVGLWDALSYGSRADALLAAAPPPLPAGPAAVAGGTLNVRERPGGKRTDRLPDGTRVTVRSCEGGWARIDYTRTGYVRAEYLKGET